MLVSLERVLAEELIARPGALGLITAFGPGFGAELGLLDAPAMAA